MGSHVLTTVGGAEFSSAVCRGQGGDGGGPMPSPVHMGPLSSECMAQVQLPLSPHLPASV